MALAMRGESHPAEPILLRLQDTSKAFGGVRALQDVSLELRRGEVHAIVGENGAGKSTLMKIIAGAVLPDTGVIEFDGAQVHLRSPKDAAGLGIAVVYQEPTFFPSLSVLENFYLGEERRGRLGNLAWSLMAEACGQALERVHLSRNLVTKRMDELALGTQELVLIARALHKRATILILDEPTAILSQAETDILFRTVHYLKEHGTSILYVSHRIPEIARIADRVTVLRDGQVTAHFDRNEATEDRIISAMTGREISLDVYHERDFGDRAPVLVVSNLTVRGVYDDVSFSLRPGEILGMYGLVGSGRSEVAATVFGTLRADQGSILLDGRPIRPGSSQEALGMGISYMPEDRQHQGLFPIRAVRDNLSAAALSSVADSLGILGARRELALARDQIQRLRIKTDGPMVPVSTLSGGGQQKVLLARWLVHQPRVLLLDEPTRGIDVGTKAEIHRLIMSLADQGVAILLISSDLPEVLGLADHVLVMHEGRVVGSLPRQHALEEVVLRLALGVGGSMGKAGTEG